VSTVSRPLDRQLDAVAAGISAPEAKQKFPNGWKSPKPYLRIVPQPR